MGMGIEYLNEYAFELYAEEEFEEEFFEDVEQKKKELSENHDNKVLNTAINCGKQLNEVTGYFPAYDVALKLKKNNWKPTPKQRQAIINVTAFYLTQKEYGEI